MSLKGAFPSNSSLPQSNRLLEARIHKEVITFFEQAETERLDFAGLEACFVSLGFLQRPLTMKQRNLLIEAWFILTQDASIFALDGTL